jgi:hypothetical protein
MLFTIGMIPTTHELTTGNLLVNGNFSQIESNGRPSNWNVSISQGNTSVQILPQKYLNLNAIQISVYSNQTSVTLTQTIQLEQNTNKNLLVMNFWYKTWIIYNSGSVRLEFYDSSNYRIANEYIKSFANNLTWTYFHLKKPIHTNATTVKVIIRMHNCMGKILMTNFSVEQVDSWENETFFVSPRQDGTIFIQWNLSNNGIGVARYDIYRGKGILSELNDIHLMVSIPTMSSYGKNIYESMYTDYSVRLNTVYTYRVLARDANGRIIDRTKLAIGQADVGEGYHDITTLIAFPRRNGIHLSWRLRAKSTAEYVRLYNGIDSISNIDRNEARLLGRYLVQDMKAIVPLFNTGPFLLVSDDETDIATVKLARLTRPRIILTPTYLAYIREKINQPGHAQEVFKALKKSSHYYQRDNSFSYGWPARDAALLYAITKNMTFVDIAYVALYINRMNYTVYDNSNIKLRFALSTMARAQAFDWAYDGFTVQQRQELIKDFQYAASIFTSYTGIILFIQYFTSRHTHFSA